MPGSLKSGFMTGLTIRPISVFIPVILRSSLSTKKEKSEGTIIFAQSARELRVEESIVVGENIIKIVDTIIKIEKNI